MPKIKKVSLFRKNSSKRIEIAKQLLYTQHKANRLMTVYTTNLGTTIRAFKGALKAFGLVNLKVKGKEILRGNEVLFQFIGTEPPKEPTGVTIDLNGIDELK